MNGITPIIRATKLNFAIVFLSSLIIISSFQACKKTDAVAETNSNLSYKERFFAKPVFVNAEIDSAISSLKTIDEKYDFVNKLPVDAGFPVWDKFIDEKPKVKNNEAARGIIKDKDLNYLIPLSIDGKTLSAVLFALYQNGKYNFYCYTNDYAYKVCNSDHFSIPLREKVLALFIYMSNYVFGISEFQKIPNHLFEDVIGKSDGVGHKFLSVKPVKEPAPDSVYVESLKLVEVCFTSWVPPAHDGLSGCNCNVANPLVCDMCERCSITKCFEDWVEPVVGGGGGGSWGDPPPLPSAEQGGGSNWIPPMPPCPGTAWYVKALLPGTGSTGGTGGCDPDPKDANGFYFSELVN